MSTEPRGAVKQGRPNGIRVALVFAVLGADACDRGEVDTASLAGKPAARTAVDTPPPAAADSDTAARTAPPAKPAEPAAAKPEEPAPAKPEEAPAAKPEAGGRATDVEYEGWRQYAVNCARCHGDDAVGGVMAPDLRASVARTVSDPRAFHSVVSDGRREKGMPAFKGVLSDQPIDAIYAYLRARAEGRIPAGRPQR